MADNDLEGESVKIVENSTKIAIIGAGVAGISCAKVLQREGFENYVILEASERIGGRILSVPLASSPGHCAELGANWVHGVEQNPIFKIACDNDLIGKYSGRSLGRKVMFARENGSPVSAKVVEDVDWIYGQLIEQCDEFFRLSLSVPYEEDSVATYVKNAFETKLNRLPNEDAHIRRMVLNQRLLGEALIAGASTMHDVSLSQVGSFEELPGVHHIIPGGFEKVVDILRKDIPDEKFLMNHIVSGIAYDREGVQVTCRNGYTCHVDHAISTLPLGCLKDLHQRLFQPSLPIEKIEALNRIGYGVVNKVVLEFDERILPAGVTRLELIWDHERPMTHLVPQLWARKIPYFEAITDTVLIGWLCGDEAEILEELDENEIGNTCETVLKAFLNRSCLPKRLRVFCSKWKKNSFSKGAYCYLPPGSSVDDISCLSEPLGPHDKPRVLFAGEATHKVYYSSSHGALLSGEREAERLIGLYEPIAQ